ncbi:4Fe-4S dicluster domain-containing protein [Teratosphaeria destructans]|uniref:4Fe-4S dicluster domain-containing protein n=1 Tax=Teratosphaeria destructans TaxID=418781 RepID=A0A9W7SZE6_9PEZI|nr:4Fe-4S dicluster domain-containing protein [Teratosphaeria destructans]
MPPKTRRRTAAKTITTTESQAADTEETSQQEKAQQEKAQEEKAQQEKAQQEKAQQEKAQQEKAQQKESQQKEGRLLAFDEAFDEIRMMVRSHSGPYQSFSLVLILLSARNINLVRLCAAAANTLPECHRCHSRSYSFPRIRGFHLGNIVGLLIVLTGSKSRHDDHRDLGLPTNFYGDVDECSDEALLRHSECES